MNPRSKRHGAALIPAIRKPTAIWRYLKDPSTPIAPKLFLLLAFAYVLMPLDLIPDAIPFVTWLDDIGVASVAIAWITRKAVQEAERVSLLTEKSS